MTARARRLIARPGELDDGLRRTRAEAADPRRVRRFRLRDQRHRRARRGWAGGRASTRWRTAIATTSSTSPSPRRASPRRRRQAGAGDRAPRRRGARPGRAAGGGDVRRSREAACWSTRSRPRPHNSGHWTIDACPASQFELHRPRHRRPAAAAGGRAIRTR